MKSIPQQVSSRLKRAYVTSFNDVNPAVLVIDIASRSIVATIPAAQGPQSAFITPDGSQVWVTYPFGNEVDVIDTLTNIDVAARIVESPFAVAFNPTGTRAYVTSGTSPGSVLAFDSATLKHVGSYKVGNEPVDVIVSASGRLVFVNNFADGTLSVTDTANGNVRTSASAGVTAMGLLQVQ